jgi:hypothetical protein
MANRVISKVVEKVTGKLVKVLPKTGELVPNPIGLGITAILYSGGLAECQTLSCDLNGDGFADEDFSKGMCRPGFN